MGSLDKNNVIIHDIPLSEIRKLGISHDPVPLRIIYGVKYKPDEHLKKSNQEQ